MDSKRHIRLSSKEWKWQSQSLVTTNYLQQKQHPCFANTPQAAWSAALTLELGSESLFSLVCFLQKQWMWSPISSCPLDLKIPTYFSVTVFVQEISIFFSFSNREIGLNTTLCKQKIGKVIKGQTSQAHKKQLCTNDLSFDLKCDVSKLIRQVHVDFVH